MSSQADAPRVSVFVQAYNTRAYVAECLDSVLSQRTRYRLEVLVIDDGSSDGTAEAIARFSDPRLRVIRHHPNAGAIATANEGYGLAAGEFVARIDSDDRVRPHFVERTVSALIENPRAGFAYGDVVTIDEGGRVTSPTGVVRRAGPAIGNELFPLLLDNYVPAPATMVRGQALASMLPVPSHYRFLDWYITTGIAENWDSCFVDDVLADYRVHGENMHRTMILDRRAENTSQDVLDTLFGHPVRQDEKRRWRRRVYARHFLTYATKYFAFGMDADARRCYGNAVRLQPQLLLDRAVARRFGATLIGRPLYEAAKARLKTLRAQ